MNKKLLVLKFGVGILLCGPLSHFSSAEPSDAVAKSTHHLSNESEAGIVVVGGNSKTSAINLKEKTVCSLDKNIITNTASYLRSDQNGIESARYWSFGLRYERKLSESIGIFLQQSIEGNIYAGFNQRYTTDLGPRFELIKNENLNLNLEAGYQYRRENQTNGNVLRSSMARLFAELIRNFNAAVSAKVNAEYIQNVAQGDDRYFNTEASINAAISSIFSIKTGYLARYRQVKPTTATQNWDTVFTTALVAKF